MNALHRDLMRLVPLIEAQESPRVEADLWRQQFHLTPPVGWLNDPNGLCYFRGNYHVFYQYGPFDPNGGVKFWGHARSRDLLHWERLPVMLCPDQPYDIHGAYSGSALVEDDTLYLYYTGNVKHAGDYDYITAGRGHNTCLAVSHDGVTADSKTLLMENRDYPAGLTCHVRDPKVWKENGRYYMVQGARTLDDRGEVLLFVSEDREHWTLANVLTTPDPLGYMWECPDLFTVGGQRFLSVSPQGAPHDGPDHQNVYSCGRFPLAGDPAGAYTLGDFTAWDYGFDFYAPQTFEDGKGRRLLIGWMGMPDADYGNPTAERGWQHCMTLPCELTLGADGTLRRNPVSEITALYGAERVLAPCADMTVSDVRTFALDWRTDGQPFTLVVRGCAVLEWSDGMLRLSFRKGSAGRTVRQVPVEHIDRLRVFEDASSIEYFVNDGETVLSTRYYPEDSDDGLFFGAGAGQASLWPLADARL